MKILPIYFSILLCATFLLASNESIKLLPAIANGDIVLGRGSDCTGRGLCTIEEKSSGVNKFLFNLEGQFTLIIPKLSISVGQSEKQFVDGFFSLPEDFQIPSHLLQKLNHSKSSEILKAGYYKVKEDKTNYTIEF